MRCLQKNTMTSFSFAYKSHERIFVNWLIVEKPSEKLSERVQWWATLRHCKHVLTTVFFYWISNFSQAIVIFSLSIRQPFVFQPNFSYNIPNQLYSFRFRKYRQSRKFKIKSYMYISTNSQLSYLEVRFFSSKRGYFPKLCSEKAGCYFTFHYNQLISASMSISKWNSTAFLETSIYILEVFPWFFDVFVPINFKIK